MSRLAEPLTRAQPTTGTPPVLLGYCLIVVNLLFGADRSTLLRMNRTTREAKADSVSTANYDSTAESKSFGPGLIPTRVTLRKFVPKLVSKRSIAELLGTNRGILLIDHSKQLPPPVKK